VSTLRFLAEIAGYRLLGSYFRPQPVAGLLPRFSARTVARCGSAYYDSFKVQARRRSTTFPSSFREIFNNVSQAQGMGRGAPPSWSPGFRDLNPIAIYF